MAQVVSRLPLTAEARVCSRFSPCGMCGGQSCSEICFCPRSLVSPVSIITPWLSTVIYHLGDEKLAPWWPQLRDTVSPHRHEEQEVN
jgi:hypothetical protein